MVNIEAINEVKQIIKNIFASYEIHDNDGSVIAMSKDSPYTFVFTFSGDAILINVIRVSKELKNTNENVLLKRLNAINMNETKGAHSVNFQHGFYTYRAPLNLACSTGTVHDFINGCLDSAKKGFELLST